MIDTHAHILPGLDDGPRNLTETEEMLRTAENDQITSIIVTPHIMEDLYPNNTESIDRALQKVKTLGRSISLYRGAEIRLSVDTLTRLIEGQYPTLNNTGYVLLEFPTYSLPPLNELVKILEQFQLRGFQPVIAHPERNIKMINDPGIFKMLLSRGIIFQATAPSLINGSARLKRLLFSLIRDGVIHLVGSDAHNLKHRPPVLSTAYKEVSRIAGQKAAFRLFIENPEKVLSGEDISSIIQ